MIEGEFGMNHTTDKKGMQSNGPNVIAGKRMEERIRKRAEMDAKAETSEFRAVSM